MIRIAIADDRMPALRDFIRCIEQCPETELVFCAKDGHDLILQMNTREKTPDIIFVDINMPFIDGIAVTYFLKFNYPTVKVIGLSGYDDTETIRCMIKSGAHGYILKAEAQSVFVNVIHAVMTGKIYIDERIGLSIQDHEKLLCEKDDKDVHLLGLTPRERTFVILNGTTLTYEQIAEIMFIETKTVQTYFDRVSKKLNVSSRQALTIFSFQNGLAKLANLTKMPNYS